jgi:hypothetical protein
MFWKMYWDEAYDRMLAEGSAVTREIVSQVDEAGVIVRRLRFTPHKELSRPMAKLIGSKKLIYEQENRWNVAASSMTWEVIPTVLPGKLSAKGTFDVVASGSGCQQVVEGDVSVNVRFIGGQIEKGIIQEVHKSYERSAVASNRWLADHG